jgi:hypothetical protein
MELEIDVREDGSGLRHEVYRRGVGGRMPMHKEERQKRESYTESVTITACSDSGHYPLTANVTHIFADDRKDLKKVNQICFENGGQLTFECGVQRRLGD